MITLCDKIHGFVILSNISNFIIEHPLFQRLKGLKQLGTVPVFANVESLLSISSSFDLSSWHTRYEHSIGVAHIGKRMALHLQTMLIDNSQNIHNSQNINLRKYHILMVEIAGLLHDIGHGPFSHVYDKIATEVHEQRSQRYAKIVLEDVYKNVQFQNDCEMLLLFQELFEDNIPISTFIDTICYLIEPAMVINDNNDINGHNNIICLDHELHFLTEIICNVTHGFDVDKFDYLQRDCFYTQKPINTTFEECHRRIENIISKSNVAFCKNDIQHNNIQSHVVFDISTSEDIQYLSNVRLELYEQVYQTPKAQLCDHLIVEQMKKMELPSAELACLVDQDILDFDQNATREIIDIVARSVVVEYSSSNVKLSNDNTFNENAINNNTINLVKPFLVYCSEQMPWNILHKVSYYCNNIIHNNSHNVKISSYDTDSRKNSELIREFSW